MIEKAIADSIENGYILIYFLIIILPSVTGLFFMFQWLINRLLKHTVDIERIRSARPKESKIAKVKEPYMGYQEQEM